ncbi:HlyD family efflux transporter periplasmic adaptor subunit [Mesorhizobium sp. M00.F.Ca.ET.151.01.1.1]|nr:HlyD family efflux transporter periplasmic adaptor subunit [bacterium M00.F.Ca.ET.199.01.1.1]TGT03204.1 HlyD family efflux transporter periplasmic adaptor subunit [bacterium M00.F.Ca.ET.177.01.1.1]TGT58140.1 HlyD family efflux transporter periplasmic adaptor subunit [Mesorhizobium sp. M00.F.Ca.ET.170.01.1.1]TGU07053.1 HlyD family efflux transporter periplasmic adaptor subunit [bacterium M00.F.Ca.ET.163.01.1.1]TGU91755.1 HlyD family efflux transporter periplasmic adaptor subunit [Mesorhizobiu
MSRDLFRTEVVEAKRTSWLGEVSLVQPIRYQLIAYGALVAAVAVIVFLTLGTYTRRSTVEGRLVPSGGMASVLAPATGVVNGLDVAEGQRVVIGQPVAVVTVPRATLSSGDTAAALEQRLQERQEGLRSAFAAQQQLFSAEASGLAEQLRHARSEVAQVEREISTRQSQVSIAYETLDRLRELQKNQYVGLIQVKQQQSAALEQVSAMQALERQAISTRRTIVQLQQAMRELPGRNLATEANFQRDAATLSQEQLETEARGAIAIRAPVNGLVATQIVKPGQAVQAGQPLLSIIAGDGKLEAELLVPSRAIGFIEIGDNVLLRYQAYPYQKFGHQTGRVAQISRSALSHSELGTLRGSGHMQESFYKVTVALAKQSVTAYGRAEMLKPGMSLDAEILGEERRLIEWLFEPLLSFRGGISDDS